MTLKENQKKHLRGLGHALHPLVTVADKGLSDSVMQEIDASLAHHELIKVKFRVGDRQERAELIQGLLNSASAELIQRIGHVALIFRSNPKEPKIKLPR